MCDSQIVEAVVRKVKAMKGQEYIRFSILQSTRNAA